MIRLNAPEKLSVATIIASGAVVTFVVVMIALFVGRGLIGQLSQNNQVLTKKRHADGQLADNLKAIAQLQTEYDQLGPKRDLILNALPTSADFPGIVSMMENLSLDAGVTLNSVTPNDTGSASTQAGSASGPTEYKFGVSISGGYPSFRNFLKNVELSMRPLTISTMKINGNASELTVDLTLKTYFQGPYDLNLKTVPLKEAK